MGYLNSKAWKELIEIVADCLSDSTRFAETYKVDKLKAEKAIRSFTVMKDMAALGGKSARQNIVDYYIKLLETYKEIDIDEAIGRAVDFNDINNNINIQKTYLHLLQMCYLKSLNQKSSETLTLKSKNSIEKALELCYNSTM